MEQSIPYRLTGRRDPRATYEAIACEPASSICVLRHTGDGFPFHLHYHPELELTLITRGRGLRFVADSIEEFDDGDLCLLGERILHTWQSSPRSHVGHAVVVQFSRDVLRPLETGWPEIAPITRLLHASAQGLRFSGRARRYLVPAIDTLAATPPGSILRMSRFLEVLAIAAADPQVVPLSSTVPPGPQDDQAAGRLNRVLQHVHTHLTGPLTLADAAALAGMPPASFCRFFARMVGKPFVRYVNEWRIRIACRELLRTSHPITRIAFDCGFENLSNFNRRFRQFKGSTPTDYRRQIGQ